MKEKVYYKIGDVATKFGVSTSLIRYWEQQFPMIKPKKNHKGTRYFTKKDVDNFGIIFHLVKEKGMTIKGTLEYIDNKKETKEFQKVEVISTLKRTKTLLEDVKTILKTRIENETSVK